MNVSLCVGTTWHLRTGVQSCRIQKRDGGQFRLAAPVIDLLDGLPRINGNDWVFAGVRGSAVGYKFVRAALFRGSLRRPPT